MTLGNKKFHEALDGDGNIIHFVPGDKGYGYKIVDGKSPPSHSLNEKRKKIRKKRNKMNKLKKKFK